MTTKVASAVVLIASLAPAAPLNDWSRVQDLHAGRKVIVFRVGGEAIHGRLAESDANRISLEAASGRVEIPRSDVAEVRKARSRLARAAQFGALGAGIGIGLAAILLAATGGSDDTAAIVIRGAVIGGAIGAAAAAAAPSGRTVYRAAGN